MSFILDALKKSEQERQRQAMPGLVESGIARPRARLPMWAIALCVLLGVNLLVLLFVLARGWMTPSPAASSAAQLRRNEAPGTGPDAQPARSDAPGPGSAAQSHSSEAPGTGPDAQPGRSDAPGTGSAAPAGRSGAQAAPPDKHFSPLDPAPVYAPEIPVTAADSPATAPPTSRQPPNPGSSGARTIRRHDPVLNDGDYKANDEEVLPSINEINLTGAQALPELHLDVHVFATKPAERFVFINMRKYHEGATLQEGPTVERIRRDGVILNYNGLRFLLPRQ
jgi:general secretion pathway protein B